MKIVKKISKNDVSTLYELNDIFHESKLLFLDDPFSSLLVIYDDNKIVGYLSYSLIYDRSEINYVIVLDEYRNRGFASELLYYFISICELNKCKNVTLEVNEHNICAIKLYTKFGFQIVAIRENYYSDGNGYLMMREFD